MKRTSAAVTGLPSENRARGSSRKVMAERSSGISIACATSGYRVKGSSRERRIKVSTRKLVMPCAAVRPFTGKGLRLSKVPCTPSTMRPPLGASGLT